MKLYKFRSLDNIEFTFDILLNERLYCANYKDLNDPFEGIFRTTRLVNLGLGLGIGIGLGSMMQRLDSGTGTRFTCVV